MTGFWYLASPYSKWRGGFEDAWEQAVAAQIAFDRASIQTYAPIVASHPRAARGNLPGDWAFWASLDHPFIEAAYGMIVLKMDGWQESFGMTAERSMFVASKKRVIEVSHPVTESDVAWVKENTPWLTKRAA